MKPSYVSTTNYTWIPFVIFTFDTKWPWFKKNGCSFDHSYSQVNFATYESQPWQFEEESNSTLFSANGTLEIMFCRFDTFDVNKTVDAIKNLSLFSWFLYIKVQKTDSNESFITDRSDSNDRKKDGGKYFVRLPSAFKLKTRFLNGSSYQSTRPRRFVWFNEFSFRKTE